MFSEDDVEVVELLPVSAGLDVECVLDILVDRNHIERLCLVHLGDEVNDLLFGLVDFAEEDGLVASDADEHGEGKREKHDQNDEEGTLVGTELDEKIIYHHLSVIQNLEQIEPQK